MDKDKIKAFRTTWGLSQEALARLLDVSLQTVYKWEKGARNPPAMLELALAELGRRLKAKS